MTDCRTMPDNTQADILANVRNKALEEAARRADYYASPNDEHSHYFEALADEIRALKTEEK